MSKHVTYLPQEVCSAKIDFDLTDDGLIRNCHFTGGCSGNLLAISKLVEGKKAEEIAALLAGNRCGGRMTSCADQFAQAIHQNCY